MKTIKFARDYPKLQDDFFTTIRTPPKKLRTGQECVMKSPSKEFKAILVRMMNLPIRNIETSVLTYDTDTRSREEAMDVLKEFYPEIQDDAMVQVLWFVKDGRDD